MRVTKKGRVIIPRRIREKLGITEECEVDFQEELGRVFLIKRKTLPRPENSFRRHHNSDAINITAEEIEALFRDMV